MTQKIVVGCCGESSDTRTLAVAKRFATSIGECELVLCYVIEWSPFSFQTPEENAERHRRRQTEIETACSRVLEPLVQDLAQAGIKACATVRHGDAAEILNAVAVERGAEQLIVARSSRASFATRFFGSVAAKLASTASVPVTVVG